MSKYFKLVGGIEFGFSLIGAIVYFVYFVKVIEKAPLDVAVALWLGLISIIFFSPALGLLFYQMGNLLEKQTRDLASMATIKKKIFDLEEQTKKSPLNQ